MGNNESLNPAQWFAIADKDLKRARYLLEGDDLEGAGFNLQQAVEKYLKGYLLSKGWTLRRIHNLETLINEAHAYDPSFEPFRAACRKISRYYVMDRYPPRPRSELSEAEMRESLQAAEEIIAQIKTLVQ
jgi:HEPN domain-containing protein